MTDPPNQQTLEPFEPDDVPEPPVDRLGIRVLSLVGPNQFRCWVERRVESVELLDSNTLRRSTSVQLSLKRIDVRRMPNDDEGTVLLPIALMQRFPHRDIQVVDEDGRVLPRLTYDEERDLVVHAVLAILKARGGSDDHAADIERVLRNPPPISRRSELAPWVAERVPEILALAGLSNAADLAELDALVDLMLQNFVVAVRLEAGGPSIRVIRYSYSESLPRLNLLYSAGRRTRRFFSGAAGDAMRFVVSSAGDAESFHITFSPPDDLEVLDSRLDYKVGTHLLSRTDDTRTSSSGHVYVSNKMQRVTEASFECHLYSSVRGAIASSAVVALFASATLLLVRNYLLHRHWMVGESFDRSSATSFALLVPAALATVVARAGEHRKATEILLPARTFLAGSAIACYAAAFSVAASGLDPHVVRWIWNACATVSGGAAARLSFLFLLQSWRLSSSRRRYKQARAASRRAKPSAATLEEASEVHRPTP